MVNEAQVLEYLRSGTVLVLGNADYIATYNASRFIDSFDIVVRFNKGVPNINTGTKAQVWAVGLCNITHQEEQWERFTDKPNYAIAFHPAVQHCSSIEKILYHDPIEQWYATRKEINYPEPSTGLMVIRWMVKNWIVPSVYGFDNFNTKTFYHLKDENKLHSRNVEGKYFNKMAVENKVKIFDPNWSNL